MYLPANETNKAQLKKEPQDDLHQRCNSSVKTRSPQIFARSGQYFYYNTKYQQAFTKLVSHFDSTYKNKQPIPPNQFPNFGTGTKIKYKNKQPIPAKQCTICCTT